MGIFGKRKSRFIGVDIGTASIKVVELSYKSGKPYLENYGWFDLAGIMQDSNPNQPKLVSYEDKMRMALSSLIAKMNLQGTSANVAIPGFSGLVVLIEFPKMKESEIESAIEFEAHKYIPASIEEVSISWEILNKNTEAGINSKMEVLLVAAPKREVQKLENMFDGTGFEIDSVELETFSIARALVGFEKGVSVIIDMGARATNLLLVVDGNVIVNRNVNVGGNDITTAIAESLNISKQRAEAFKKEEKDILNERETAIILPPLELLTGEVKRIIYAFKEKNKKANVERIIISGGSSELYGLDKYFSRNFGIETVKGDPMKNIAFNSAAEPFLKKIGTSFSVAIGLAIRGMEDAGIIKKQNK